MKNQIFFKNACVKLLEKFKEIQFFKKNKQIFLVKNTFKQIRFIYNDILA